RDRNVTGVQTCALPIFHSYYVFYAQYRSSGWTSPVQITSTSLNDTSPSAAVGRDGTVWLVWTRVNSTNHSVPAIKQLYYKSWKRSEEHTSELQSRFDLV